MREIRRTQPTLVRSMVLNRMQTDRPPSSTKEERGRLSGGNTKGAVEKCVQHAWAQLATNNTPTHVNDGPSVTLAHVWRRGVASGQTKDLNCSIRVSQCARCCRATCPRLNTVNDLTFHFSLIFNKRLRPNTVQTYNDTMITYTDSRRRARTPALPGQIITPSGPSMQPSEEKGC